MADNVPITAGSGTTISTEEVTTLNGGSVSAQHLQRVANAIRTADGTAVDLPGDATNGLDVDVTRVSGDVTVVQSSSTNLRAQVGGFAAHGATVTGNPMGVGRTNGLLPTAEADGEASWVWLDRYGAVMTRPAWQNTYLYNIASTVHVNSANTVMWDFFNADATLLVRVMSIRQIPNITTAVTGVVFDWLLERTTAVGTGGTAQTAWLPDTSQTSLDADITCRLKPSGGATQSTDLWNYSLSSEETNAATIQIASQGGLELVPPYLIANGHGILLRQNQGLRCVQITASAAGNTGWLISFIVE